MHRMTTSNFKERFRRDYARIGVAVAISLLIHLLVVIVVPLPDPEVAEIEDSDEEFQVEILDEDPTQVPLERPSIPVPDPQRDEIAEVVPLPEEEPEPVEPEPMPDDRDDRKAVEQETNEARPQEANFVSEQDNRVDDETRAEETELEGDESAREDQEDREQQRREEVEKREATRRGAEQTREAEVSPEDTQPEELTEGEIPRKIDPAKLFATPVKDYEKVLGNASREQKAREASKAQDGRDRLLPDFEARDESFRASLENFIPEVKPGNHTGVNAHRNVYATYIARIHRKIHVRWADRYLGYLDTRKPLGDPLNNPRLRTVLEFVIEASTGQVEKVNIVTTSGEMQFDSEAISIAHAVGPHPAPPEQIVSPDGRVYIHWAFNRDQRQCGTFGASVFLVDRDRGPG